MTRTTIVLTITAAILLVSAGFLIGVYYANDRDLSAVSPAIFNSEKKVDTPLVAYTFPELRTRLYTARTIEIVSEIAHTDQYTSYLFTYDPLGKKMSGQLNIPNSVTSTTPVIVMLRGYVPPEIFATGVGTKNAAAVFARNGYITIAPDFFGYGESDDEPTDSWQARFEKPIIVIELIKSIQEKGVPTVLDNSQLHATQKIGIWGHSNGGQIAMSTLVTLQKSIPTTLWAPVLAPFPYSILYFTDEHEDEGKGMRIWLNQLEDDYDLRQFSFTQYLDGLIGPLQIQHGTNDEAAPHIWSDEFVTKITTENERRAAVKNNLSTATESATNLEPIKYYYTTYPGADHNMQPSSNWDKAVAKDLEFFQKELAE